MAKKSILQINNQQYELPLIEGTEGEIGIDIRNLREQTGCITYDPGFGNTGACDSEICYIDLSWIGNDQFQPTIANCLPYL